MNKVEMTQRPIRRLLDVDDHDESDINMSLAASTSASMVSPSVRRSKRNINSPVVNYKDSLRFVTIYQLFTNSIIITVLYFAGKADHQH